MTIKGIIHKLLGHKWKLEGHCTFTYYYQCLRCPEKKRFEYEE